MKLSSIENHQALGGTIAAQERLLLFSTPILEPSRWAVISRRSKLYTAIPVLKNCRHI